MHFKQKQKMENELIKAYYSYLRSFSTICFVKSFPDACLILLTKLAAKSNKLHWLVPTLYNSITVSRSLLDLKPIQCSTCTLKFLESKTNCFKI